ncbi:BTAD domain-containing putative transcriptional regulator [Pseudogulbenkiania sp. MAI-1]|uniref:BTAD domain-containing putative transcriptional regulator n=1 Tax=Pseudogulbenkiania sp. MAI-1 TaxID=990370 RepID=UPI00045E9043|nr:BTAD domain-containing putative transcriptional regulator [Pseudogulbenkiania sp. MAI-1]
MHDEAGAANTTFARTTRPEIGGILRREALFSRLDGLPGRIAVWISGPAGAGKSTLAASYVDARAYQSAWYQVDPGDVDIATFFHYLGHATRRLATGPLPAFDTRYGDNLASFSRHFFRQLFARLSAPSALVLDGLPPLPTDGALRIALEAGLGEVPRHCCVVITSRSEPPASLARRRVSGELVYVGADELRLTSDELAAVASLRGKPLGAETALRVHQRTQGWAAGVVLMLEHAKIVGHLAELSDDTPPQVVFDYLAGEIFERFPVETQRFLLRIACLTRTTADVAAALSGEEKAGRLLLNLAHNDYFVREVIGDTGRIFHIHPLLRDFLHSRATVELPEAVAAPALRRAAQLLHAAGQFEEAVALFVESHDWPGLADLASELAETMLTQGRWDTLAGWLDLLPPELLDEHPRLLLASAACRLHASPRTARQQFERAFAGCQRAGDADGLAKSCAGIIDAIVAEFDDLASLDPWLVELIACSPAAGTAIAATLGRALLLRDPTHPALTAWLGGSASGRALPDEALVRSMAAMLRGDFAGAATITNSIAAADPAMRIGAALSAALRHFLDGDYIGAGSAARAGRVVGDAEAIHTCDIWLTMLDGAAALGAGDRGGARCAITALDTMARRRGDRAIAHYLRSWLADADGERVHAEREAKSALLLAVEAGLPWVECLARLAVAQFICATGDRHGAAAQVRAAAALAERLASPLLRVPTLFAEAAVELEGGGVAVLVPLRAALTLAREHGLQHIVGIQRRLVAELCATALTHGVETEFTRSLVRASRLAPPPAALRLAAWPWPFEIVTLGGFALRRDGEAVEFSAKGPGRPVELLKVLVALGGRNVRADHLADALWPHIDADYAHKSFTATLHRLRRILDDDEALILRDGRLSLNPARFRIDLWVLDRCLANLDAQVNDGGPATDVALQALFDECLTLYAGPFLADETDQAIYVACREQLRARLLRVLNGLTRHREGAGRIEELAASYLRCIAADELGEAFYRQLMLCYQRHGDRVEALAIYQHLRTVLAARLKSTPSPETEAVYASLAGQGPPLS